MCAEPRPGLAGIEGTGHAGPVVRRYREKEQRYRVTPPRRRVARAGIRGEPPDRFARAQAVVSELAAAREQVEKKSAGDHEHEDREHHALQ
ncbi:hypothetical protein D3C83_39510 [compost metagenome]